MIRSPRLPTSSEPHVAWRPRLYAALSVAPTMTSPGVIVNHGAAVASVLSNDVAWMDEQ